MHSQCTNNLTSFHIKWHNLFVQFQSWQSNLLQDGIQSFVMLLFCSSKHNGAIHDCFTSIKTIQYLFHLGWEHSHRHSFKAEPTKQCDECCQWHTVFVDGYLEEFQHCIQHEKQCCPSHLRSNEDVSLPCWGSWNLHNWNCRCTPMGGIYHLLNDASTPAQPSLFSAVEMEYDML